MQRDTVLEIDLTDPALYADGSYQAALAELRAAGPVHRNPAVTVPPYGERVEFWSVVRHGEIQLANRDWASFSSRDGVSLGRGDPRRNGHMLTAMDPPDHQRLRRLIMAGFTNRMVRRLEEQIAARSRRILDAAACQGGCDFVADVAYQVPMHVIADIVGIAEADRSWVFERTEQVIEAFDTTSGVTVDDQRRANSDLFEYAQQLTKEKRAAPADDVWTLIAQATVEDADGGVHRIEGLELENFFQLLSLAGSETTRNALSQGLLALFDHPAQLRELGEDPQLVGTAADEMIRWASPVMYFGRTAARDVEIGGQPITAGDRVVLWYVSGNRDERAFADPFRFDIRRQPNPHVSFGGGGVHYCLGANLAKLEVQVLAGMLARDYVVEPAGEPRWSAAGAASNVGLSLNALPVRISRRLP